MLQPPIRMGDKHDIVIAGVGLITPLGGTLQQTWNNLLAGRFITDHCRAMKRREGDEPNVIELADIAAKQAIAAAGWDNELRDDRTALIVGTSKGPADEWLVGSRRGAEPPETSTDFSGADESRGSTVSWPRAGSPCSERRHPPTSDKPSCEFVTSVPKCESVPSGAILPGLTSVVAVPACPRISGLHEIAEALSSRLELMTGPKLTVSAACASGMHALFRAAMLLQQGDADRVLVVASESSLHEAFIHSFRRLGVIATPGEPCRPFDRNRSGFLISEAAAAICLECRLAKPGEVVMDGYAIGADASHLTSTNPQALALKSCLKRVLNGRPTDLIHAHATGTVANDPIELSAIDAIAGDGQAIIYSHKGSFGHTLGASGMVATVLNWMAHQTRQVPGNVSTLDPLATSAGRISRETVNRPIRRSIAIAAGFGGATGVVGLRTV